MNERALEREALAHAAREARHRVVAPFGQAGALERGVDAPPRRGEPYSLGEEQEVLAAVSSG